MNLPRLHAAIFQDVRKQPTRKQFAKRNNRILRGTAIATFVRDLLQELFDLRGGFV